MLADRLQKTGVPAIHPSRLPAFFATTCIESGVDIPTVSRRLGHKDGGALAMKRNGHLRATSPDRSNEFRPIRGAGLQIEAIGQGRTGPIIRRMN
jgi:integrase